MVKLSIIIPTLNEEKYLPRLLESIKMQTFKDYELVVSDSSSSDSTLKIAKKYKCRTVIIKNGSPAKGRNAGANIAKGEILVFIDSDSLLDNEDFLKGFYEEFKQRDLGSCTVKYYLTSGLWWYKLLYVIQNLGLSMFQYLSPFACGYFIACRADIHKKINGFDEEIFYGEDSDYVKRAARVGRFRICKISIGTSPRRFEKEGTIYLLKVLYVLFYTLFLGFPRKRIYKYEFGNY